MSRDRLLDYGFDLPSHAVPRALHGPLAACATQQPGEFGIGEERHESISERYLVACVDEQAGFAMSHHLSHGAGISSDAR